MSRIRSRGTKIEKIMRTVLEKNSFEFTEHPDIYAKPDFLVGRRTLIFCDGDFWHGYKYNEKKKPAKKFWKEKIQGNMKRDRGITRELRRDGWAVLRFWEHDIEKNPEKCIRRIKTKIKERNRVC